MGYLYGFNGKENDSDFGNDQLVQDYGFRIYNPSIARFLSVDPLSPEYPELTPYQFASNTPIWAVDLDGLESAYSTEVSDQGSPAIKIVSKGKIELEQFEKRHDLAKTQDEKDQIAIEAYLRLAQISREEAGWNVAANHLEHFIKGDGETLDVPNYWLINNSSAEKGLQKNNNYVLNGAPACSSCKDIGLIDFALNANLEDGQSVSYNTRWETLVQTLGDGEEISFILGDFTLSALSNITLTREGNTARVNGTITQSVIDRYDFTSGKILVVGGFEILDDWQVQLENRGKASSFDVRGGTVIYNVGGTINLDDGTNDIILEEELPAPDRN